MAVKEVVVPDIGGAEGAEVIELLVAVGDSVEVEQGLIVLESDKASMEIPSTEAGTVVELLVSEGQELEEGAVVARIEVTGAGDAAAEPDATPAPAEETPTAPEAEPEPVPEAAPEQAAAAGGESVVEVAVPDIGGAEGAEVIELLVAVGDSVEVDQGLIVLESDKASMEIPATVSGTVTEVLVSVGEELTEGSPVARLKVSGAAPAASAPAPAAEKPAAEPAPKPAQEPRPAAPAPAAPAATSSGIYAGPAVRKLAREFGVALDKVGGTGPSGRILKEDVQQYVSRQLSGEGAAAGGAAIPEVPAVDFGKFGPVEVTQRSKLDKVTASNMHRSWLNVPHVTQFDDADITDLEEFRQGLKPEMERRGEKLSTLPFVLKECAVALQENPKLNSSLASGGDELVHKQYVHIGMAVDTPAGLVVPVLRDVDRKSVWEIAAEVLDLAGKARDRKLKPNDMQGGTFTVSSLGNIGGNGFTPIVNTPEVGILGVSNAAVRPVWNGSEFEPRKQLPLALSYDHRVVNGGDGGRFLSRVVSLLSDIRQLSL
ncbi:MAG: dihydrolipoyllysine-residue acetyltransferase [Halioglobus sp.]|nr:dihydrolipoyllysine-residue acetyltransferase [Halioglobus sp.]